MSLKYVPRCNPFLISLLQPQLFQYTDPERHIETVLSPSAYSTSFSGRDFSQEEHGGIIMTVALQVLPSDNWSFL